MQIIRDMLYSVDMRYITFILIMFVLFGCSASVTNHDVAKAAANPNPFDTVKPAGPIVLVKNVGTGALCSAVVIDESTLLASRTCIGPAVASGNLVSGRLFVYTSDPESDETCCAASWADTYASATAFDIAIIPLLRPLPPGSTPATLSYVPLAGSGSVETSIVGWGCSGGSEMQSHAAHFLGAFEHDQTTLSFASDATHNIALFQSKGTCRDLGAGVLDASGDVVGIIAAYPAFDDLPIEGLIMGTLLGAAAADIQAKLAQHSAVPDTYH